MAGGGGGGGGERGREGVNYCDTSSLAIARCQLIFRQVDVCPF